MIELDTATKQAIAEMTDDDYRAWQKSLDDELRPPAVRTGAAGRAEAERRKNRGYLR